MRINLINNFKNVSYVAPLVSNPFRPKLNVLKQDTFEKSNEPSFEGRSCSTESFEIKHLYDMPCPCCGQKMVTNQQVASFTENVVDKKGEDLVKILKRYEDYYRPIEKEVVHEISKYSSVYPNENIAGLTQKISILRRNEIISEQTLVIDELRSMTPLVDKNRRKAYEQFLDDSQKLVNEFNDDRFFKRKSFIQKLEGTVQGAVSQKTYDKMKETATKMPNSLNNTSAFFIKYARRGQTEIASRLLNQGLSTAEHVVPRARGGEDNTSNYIAMCSKCNSTRGTTPYADWFNVHPEMPENLQKYLDEVVRRSKIGELKGYEDYPYDIIETIRKESKGKANLEVNEDIPVGNVLRGMPKGLTKEERIEIIQKRCDKSKEELEELEKTAEELKNDEEYQNLVKYFAVKKELAALKTQMAAMSEKMADAKQAQVAQENRKKNVQKIEQALEDPEITSKEKQKYQDKLRRAENRIKKHTNDEEENEKVKKEYEAVAALYSSKKAELEELEKIVKLPEYYEAKEKELQGKLSEIYALQGTISTLTLKASKKGEIQKRRSELEARIKELQYQLSLDEGSDIESGDEDPKTKQKYETLVRKRDFLQSIGPSDVSITKKMPRGLKPDFVVKEAKKSVESQLEELYKIPYIQRRHTAEEIEALKEEKEECSVKLAEIAEIEKKIIVLEEKLKKCQEGGLEENLVEELKEVRQNKKRIERKVGYINIEQKISAAKEFIKEYEEEIAKIKAEK